MSEKSDRIKALLDASKPSDTMKITGISEPVGDWTDPSIVLTRLEAEMLYLEMKDHCFSMESKAVLHSLFCRIEVYLGITS